jgi:hypothetical protein
MENGLTRGTPPQGKRPRRGCLGKLTQVRSPAPAAACSAGVRPASPRRQRVSLGPRLHSRPRAACSGTPRAHSQVCGRCDAMLVGEGNYMAGSNGHLCAGWAYAPIDTCDGCFSLATGGLFGATTNQSTGGGLFGASTPAQPGGGGGLFRANAPATTGGLFGSSLATQQPAGGLFGAQTPGAGKPTRDTIHLTAFPLSFCLVSSSQTYVYRRFCLSPI